MDIEREDTTGAVSGQGDERPGAAARRLRARAWQVISRIRSLGHLNHADAQVRVREPTMVGDPSTVG
jgi:hypothetical protein